MDRKQQHNRICHISNVDDVDNASGSLVSRLVLRWWPWLVSVDQVELMAVPSAFALTAVRVPPSTGPAPSSEVDSDLPEIQTTLTGGGSGLMRCSECDFMTVSRAQYKMHAMKHRPRTWQCGHCSVNFTLLYVRRLDPVQSCSRNFLCCPHFSLAEKFPRCLWWALVWETWKNWRSWGLGHRSWKVRSLNHQISGDKSGKHIITGSVTVWGPCWWCCFPISEADSLRVTLVVGRHYFLSGPWLPSQLHCPLPVPASTAWWTEANVCVNDLSRSTVWQTNGQRLNLLSCRLII